MTMSVFSVYQEAEVNRQPGVEISNGYRPSEGREGARIV